MNSHLVQMVDLVDLLARRKPEILAHEVRNDLRKLEISQAKQLYYPNFVS